jgi:hemolysin III
MEGTRRDALPRLGDTVGEAFETAYDAVTDTYLSVTGSVSEAVSEVLADLKPKLRGWLHLITAPLALAAGIVLIALSPAGTPRVGSVIFTCSALLLFGVSAIYHTGTWSPKTWAFLRRFDHSNVFVLIAGSYTPFAIILLEGVQQATLLGLVWGGALAGVAFRIFWTDAPRWLYTPIYIALGWAAIFFIPGFYGGAKDLGTAGVAAFIMIVVGGGLYTLGGAVYGFKFPNPSPRYFGFHEVFHAFTVLAFASHYIGVSLATYALR